MIESGFIEYRPKLQSANLFIKLAKNYSGNFKVNLFEDNFEIKKENNIFLVDFKRFKAIPSTLSSLKISENNISCSFFTNSSDRGSFKSEVLQKNGSSSSIVLKNRYFFEKNLNYMVKCKSCENNLNNNVITFERVLPLPSSTTDSSEWFCHGHSSTNVSLEPNKSDIFYSNCFIHLCKENIQNIKEKDNVVVCKFCLAWLGVIYKQNTLKFWLNTMYFLSKNGKIQTDPLQDVFISIKGVLQNNLFNSVKTILKYTISDTKSNHLLIWILEKELNLALYEGGSVHFLSVAKVLFKFVENSDYAILLQWKSEVNVDILEISKPMMLEVLQHLYKYNKIFPVEFSKTNDFSISYLMLS